MKRNLFLGLAAASLLVASATTWVHAGNTAAVGEVLKLHQAGMGEETIVAFIQSKGVNYDLSAEDLISLRNQGLPTGVVNAMVISGATRPAQPAPVTAQQPAAVIMPTPAPGPATAPTTAVVAAPVPVVIAQPMQVNRPVVVAQPAIGADAAYFYQELSPYGRWILAEDNQWYWQPTVAATSAGWRPYWDKGRWVYTDNGWYWSSEYTWGWAAFHYGRWHLHPHHGWLWYPDRVWGPAWVTWRSGGDYCGWAPLPPGTVYDRVGGGFLYRGRHVGVEFDFGLDFGHFSFAYVRELGEPMRAHWRRPDEMRDIFRRTTIVNNYTVVHNRPGGHGADHVFNHGIEPSRVSAGRHQAITTVRIEEMRTPAPGRGRERIDTRNQTMQVYRPRWGDAGHR